MIEKILDYSTDFVATVQTFRLVCKQWRTIATKKYRSKYGRICFENDFNRKTAKFIQVMRNSNDMLFDKFKLSGGYVIYKPLFGHYGYNQVYNELFRICVPWMKDLQFKSHNPCDLKFPKSLQKYNLTKLTTLSFHICVFYKDLQMEMADYLGEIFDGATNLKSFDFRLVSYDPSLLSENQLVIMQKFGDVIGQRIPKSCSHLKMNIILSPHHFSLLEERGLNLETLIIDFQKIFLPSQVITSFLASQSSSLKILEFIEAPLSADMVLPVLPLLTSLKIEGKPRIPSFKFETVFPNLKSLEILFYWIYQDENWLQNILLDAGTSRSVHSVNLLCEVNESDLFVLYRVVKTFPKLKRLNSVLNTLKALTTVFTSMTFLEDLEISLAKEFWESRGPTVRMGKVDEVSETFFYKFEEI